MVHAGHYFTCFGEKPPKKLIEACRQERQQADKAEALLEQLDFNDGDCEACTGTNVQESILEATSTAAAAAPCEKATAATSGMSASEITTVVAAAPMAPTSAPEAAPPVVQVDGLPATHPAYVKQFVAFCNACKAEKVWLKTTAELLQWLDKYRTQVR